MIITCPNCNKQFKINPSQIPSEGRDLKCGSCNHIWFYKIEEKKTESSSFNQDIITNEVKSTFVEDIKDQIIINKQNQPENKDYLQEIKKQIPKKSKKNDNISGKIFSYLVVSVISFVALIILLDTFKTPLIKVFPGLNDILSNLFEILKDIKLFIIDLN
tara:strand:+ start:49 stop:528 length:480 start_codon:yes stop_codon:yes gene_type:complete